MRSQSLFAKVHDDRSTCALWQPTMSGSEAKPCRRSVHRGSSARDVCHGDDTMVQRSAGPFHGSTASFVRPAGGSGTSRGAATQLRPRGSSRARPRPCARVHPSRWRSSIVLGGRVRGISIRLSPGILRSLLHWSISFTARQKGDFFSLAVSASSSVIISG
jgi:hypothetical protein